MKSCPACKSNYPTKTPRCPLDGSALVEAGPDLLAGRVVGGHYRLIDRCGAGPTAEVYRTYDVRTGAQVAVRIPTPHASTDPWYRARLQDQVRCFHRAAPHDALVPVLDVVEGAVAGRTLVVTEFVTTPSLPAMLVTGALDLHVALDAAAQLAALLEHLHARDVLARDLRAGAVFVPTTPGAQVRVTIDALASGPVAAAEPVLPTQALAPHVAVGYLAPERVRGEPGVPASDVYALGALVFEIVTGRPMFQGDAREVVSAHASAPPPVLRQVRASMPGSLEALLMRMFAKVSRFRPTAAEARVEFTAIRASLLV